MPNNAGQNITGTVQPGANQNQVQTTLPLADQGLTMIQPNPAGEQPQIIQPSVIPGQTVIPPNPVENQTQPRP